MDLVVRAAVIFAVLDVVLIIVIAEVTGNSLSGQDYSITASVVVIVTLVALDILVSWLKVRSKRFDKVAEGVPVLLLENGRPIRENLRKERVDEGDILEAAREAHGLERLDQIRYAVLEKGGAISIIPRAGVTP